MQTNDLDVTVPQFDNFEKQNCKSRRLDTYIEEKNSLTSCGCFKGKIRLEIRL